MDSSGKCHDSLQYWKDAIDIAAHTVKHILSARDTRTDDKTCAMWRRNAIILRSINWRRVKLTCRNKHVGVALWHQGDASREWTSRVMKKDGTIHGGGKMREKRDANALPEVSGGVLNAKREVCLMVRTVEREIRGECVSKGWWEVITDGWWGRIRWGGGREGVWYGLWTANHGSVRFRSVLCEVLVRFQLQSSFRTLICSREKLAPYCRVTPCLAWGSSQRNRSRTVYITAGSAYKCVYEVPGIPSSALCFRDKLRAWSRIEDHVDEKPLLFACIAVAFLWMYSR